MRLGFYRRDGDTRKDLAGESAAFRRGFEQGMEDGRNLWLNTFLPRPAYAGTPTPRQLVDPKYFCDLYDPNPPLSRAIAARPGCRHFFRPADEVDVC